MARLFELHPEGSAFLKKYEKLTPIHIRHLKRVSAHIKGTNIIHVNSTGSLGGVAEILRSQVPLERALGLKSKWLTMRAPHKFYQVTKKLHNTLQGEKGSLTNEEKKLYVAASKKLAVSLTKHLKNLDAGVLVIHDPQPLGLIDWLTTDFATILRLHIDLSTPNKKILKYLSPHIKKYEKIVVSSNEYTSHLHGIKNDKLAFSTPAINPFDAKNSVMSQKSAKEILRLHGLDTTRPIISQVSRFDPWKDPIGVIDAYYKAADSIPGLQLILVGFRITNDDPQADEIFKKVKAHSFGNKNIHLFSELKQLKNISNAKFVNAIYTASDIILQKSIKEGFGMTITEAMLHGKPVIVGKTHGTLLQVNHRKNGIVVSSVPATTRAIVELMNKPALRKKLGRAAQKSARQKFLIPRLVLDHVILYRYLLTKRR